MPYKDPEVRRAKQRIRSARNHAAHKETINAKKRSQYWADPIKRAQRSERQKASWPAYYAANKGRILAKGAVRRDRSKLAGRSPPQFCEICGNLPNGRGKRLQYDHCHQRGHFRGWICTNCNSALGHVHDDINHLRKLIAYLERTDETTPRQTSLPGI